MNPYSIPPLLSSILFIILGVFIFWKNKKAKINIAFLFICLCTAWWQFSWFLLFNTSNKQIAEILVRVGHVGIIFIPIAFYHYYILFIGKKTKFDSWLLALSYLLGTLFILSLPTNLFINGYYKYYWGFYPKAGILHPIYLVLLSILALKIIFSLLAILTINKKGLTALKYYQAKYLLLAIIIYTFASSDFLVNYGIEFYPLGFIAIFIFLLIIGYSIAKYRLMDIRIAIRSFIVYSSTIIILILFIFGILYIINYYKNYQFDQSLIFFNLVITMLALLFFTPIKIFIEKMVNRNIFKTLYTSRQALDELTSKTTSIIELEKLMLMIVGTVKKALGLNRAGILLFDSKTDNYQVGNVSGFKLENGISLVRSNYLTEKLEKQKSILLLQELETEVNNTAIGQEVSVNIKKLVTNMKRIEASICIPLIFKEKLIGILVLGEKISNEAYTKEDLIMLNILGKQTTVAIQNAKLYKEVQNFNKTLQKKVDEQTEDLKELLNMKTEFLTVASHQLRTPTSVVKSALDMVVKNEVKGEQREQFINNAYLNSIRLERIISDLLLAMDIEGSDLELLSKPVQPNEAAKRAYDARILQAKEKGLEYLVNIPKEDLPFIVADEQKLVDTLTGLLDNSINYTKTGKVEIGTYLDKPNNEIVIYIKDTGMGIKKDEMKKLFKKFDRTKRAIITHPDGSGLGLFIAKQIITAMGGTIKLLSEGEDKGSEAIIRLKVMPIK